MKNIFFFDFDETLYSHRKKAVAPNVRQALDGLRKNKDNVVAVASGRGRESEHFIREALGFEPDYLILMNGQLAFAKGRLVYENFAETSRMKAVMNLAQSKGYACGGYYAEGILVNRINSRVQQVWHEFGSAVPRRIPDFQQHIPLYQGHLYMTKAEAEHLSDVLKHYVINWSHPYLINLIPESAGKSQAIRWCLETLKIAKEASYAFGDGFNDHDMLKAVGHGIAMGNSGEALKAAAEYVTAPVDGEGVVDALRHYGCI